MRNVKKGDIVKLKLITGDILELTFIESDSTHWDCLKSIQGPNLEYESVVKVAVNHIVTCEFAAEQKKYKLVSKDDMGQSVEKPIKTTSSIVGKPFIKRGARAIPFEHNQGIVEDKNPELDGATLVERAKQLTQLRKEQSERKKSEIKDFLKQSEINPVESYYVFPSFKKHPKDKT